jgi:predicted transcriptional regulator
MGQLRHREYIAVPLDKAVAAAIRQMSKDTDIPMSRIIEKALLEFYKLQKADNTADKR